jgi:hypothetical protein
VNNNFDLNNIPPNHNFDIKLSKEEDSADKNIRRIKDIVVFLLAIGLVVSICYMCFETLHSQSASQEEKKWAMSIFSATAAGIIGYLLKK